MNCIKLHESDCKYRMPCDKGQCIANLCQKTLDDIVEGINILIALQQPPDVLPDNVSNNIISAKKARR